MKHFFITGGSGVVGSAIVPKLLVHPATKVSLLLRAGSQRELAERRAALLAFWELPPESPAAARLRFYRGDITRPNLSLDQDDYRNLMTDITHLVHAAGNVKLNSSLRDARRDALTGMQHVAAFACAARREGRLEKLELLSTVGVAGRRTGMLLEEPLLERRSYHNNYERAKAECEEYALSMVLPMLPATIHRLSMVVGDSGSGRIISFQIFYYLCELYAGLLTGGLVPRLERLRLDVVPVDYVAAAVVWSARTNCTAGKILHLCSGSGGSLSIADLSSRCREQFGVLGALPPLRPLPLGAFRKSLAQFRWENAAARRRAAVLPYFLAYAGGGQAFDNARTQQLLQEAGLALPHPDVFLPPALAYYLTRRRVVHREGNKRRRVTPGIMPPGGDKTLS